MSEIQALWAFRDQSLPVSGRQHAGGQPASADYRVRVVNPDNRLVSGYYSSKQPFTNGKRVRDWLADQPLTTQQDFGVKILEKFGAS